MEVAEGRRIPRRLVLVLLLAAAARAQVNPGRPPGVGARSNPGYRWEIERDLKITLRGQVC